MPELVLTKKGANGHHKFTLTVTETSYSIENNTSTVSYSLTISKVHSDYDYNWGTNNASAYTETVTINGETKTAHNGKYDGSSVTTYISGTQVINHDADGSKTITCSFSVDDKTGQTYTSGDASASGTLTLTTIPRASTFNASSYSGTLGTAMNITYTSASNSFTHTLTFDLGSTTIGTNNTSGTFSWTPAYSLATNNTSGTTLSGTLTLITYSGSTELGRKTAPCSLTIPNNSTTQPSISIATSDTNGYLSTYGAYVYTKSILKITPTITYKYNSSIKTLTYTLRKNNASGDVLTTASYSSFYTFSYTTNYVGTIHITTTITDSRNFSSSTTSTITVANYVSPNVSQFQCERDSTTESTINCYITGSSTNINNRSLNTTTWTLQYKKTTAITWTTANTWTGYTLSKQPQTITGTDVNATYDVKLTAVDQFSTVSKTSTVTSTFTLMNFSNGGKGIAFGKSSETEELFECDLQTKFNKDTRFYENASISGNVIGGKFETKNLLNLEQCRFEHCTLNNDKSVTSNINNFYFCCMIFTYLNDFILNNKGKNITFSISQAIANRKVTIVIYGTRTGGGSYQEFDSTEGASYISGTIASDFTSVTQVEVRFNRSPSTFTDTTTTRTDFMLEIGTTTPTTYTPYQNLNVQPDLLYNSSVGNNSSITVGKPLTNYYVLEIMYSSSDGVNDTYNSVRVYNPSGGSVIDLSLKISYSTAVTFKNSKWTISGNTISLTNANSFSINSSGVYSFVATTNTVYIKTILGYR